MVFLTRDFTRIFLSFAIICVSNDLFASTSSLATTEPADFENSYFVRNPEAASAQNRKYFYDLNEKSFWQKIKGMPTSNRLLLGMFSLHLMPYFKRSHHSSHDNWNNQMIAISYHGYFVGTLINSLYKRAYAAGIERYWFTTKVNENFDYSLGYRLGLITGYTKKTYPFAKYSPVLPFPQMIFDMSIRHVQIELSWCFQVISLGFAYRF